MRLAELVEVSARIAATRSRRAKTSELAALLRAAGREEAEIAVSFLSGEPRQGRLGLGPASLRRAWPDQPAATPSLTLAAVDAAFAAMTTLSGAGAGAARLQRLRELLATATAAEQDFLARLVLGELRQGALEGVMVDALAAVAGIAAARVRRALMLAGDVRAVAAAALGDDPDALDGFGLSLLRPLQPMLAASAETVEEALAAFGRACFEIKLDGARVQVHRAGEEIRVFTRRLNDITASVPEVVEAVAALPVEQVLLDGEALALHPDGTPRPFQETMQRIGRREAAGLREELPLSVFFFDCLHRDGVDLVDRPLVERQAELDRAVAPALRTERLVTDDPAAADAFLSCARTAGHEGVMAKALDAPYEAGRRGSQWLKIKPVHTLDLVVLAGEWGSGRRRGRLSNLHLGARDPERGGFVMLGKTFKGLTDELLEWQTGELLALERRREGAVVHVEPRLVVEIAFNGIQASPHYPGGLALRFARVRGYRPDKTPAEADTIATVRAIHARE